MATEITIAGESQHKMDISISESSVSLRLTHIRKRCEELMEEGENELQLEEADGQASDARQDAFNPYNRSN